MFVEISVAVSVVLDVPRSTAYFLAKLETRGKY
jgi:hypothetical protein